mgnify:CR=1 FL=1
MDRKNWEIVTGCERLTPGCDSCPSYWEYKEKGLDYNPVFNDSLLREPIDNNIPTQYLVALGSDIFHEAVKPEEIAAVFDVIRESKHHWFEIATKRVERMHCLMKGIEWPINVSLSVSIESSEYLWRLEYLKSCGAKFKAVSMVPLLGGIGKADFAGVHLVGIQPETWGFKRPMRDEWAEEIETQCNEQGVMFLNGEIDLYKKREVA